MEPIFWLLFNGGIALFLGAILAGIVVAIIHTFKSHRLAEQYIEKGIITKKQRKQLPDVLLKKGRTALSANRFGEAYSCFTDCLKLAEWNGDDERKNSANFELARYYAAKEKDEKALELLSSLFTPHAYLLKGELLARQDRFKNHERIRRYAEEAMKCEELQSRALGLFMDDWDGTVDGRISPKMAEHRKKMDALFSNWAPMDMDDDFVKIRKNL